VDKTDLPISNSSLRSTVIIPARLESTRLPRKLLLAETGKTLLQHTYEAASRATRATSVVVAADCQEIVEAVLAFGGRVELTSPNWSCGTDRVAQLACNLSEMDVIVNVQGDEPDITGPDVDLVIELLEKDHSAVMSTLASPIRSKRQLNDLACVKVVFNQRNRALYFSRAPIPLAREWDESVLLKDPPHYYQHIGVYAYRREFLARLSSLPVAEIERIECLEQLRVLHAGYDIHVGIVESTSRGIDTPADYRAFVSRYTNRAKG
jgi:3-deoxy-manno-octulosonate cytidylyltransferase (CMP-KDO synthetase)